MDSILPHGYKQLKCIISEAQPNNSENLVFEYVFSYSAKDTIEIKYRPIENIFTKASNPSPYFYDDGYIDLRRPKTDVFFTNYFNIRLGANNARVQIGSSSSYEEKYYKLKAYTDNENYTHLSVDDTDVYVNFYSDYESNQFNLCGNPSDASRYAFGCYEYFKITDYNSNELKLDWIPALEEATGIAGFFDIVNNKFVAPSQGVAGYENL